MPLQSVCSAHLSLSPPNLILLPLPLLSDSHPWDLGLINLNTITALVYLLHKPFSYPSICTPGSSTGFKPREDFLQSIKIRRAVLFYCHIQPPEVSWLETWHETLTALECNSNSLCAYFLEEGGWCWCLCQYSQWFPVISSNLQWPKTLTALECNSRRSNRIPSSKFSSRGCRLLFMVNV